MVKRNSSSNKKLSDGQSKTEFPFRSTDSQPRKSIRTRIKSHQAWSFQPKISNLGIVLNAILPDYTTEFYSACVNDVRDLITSLIRNHGFTDGAARYGIVKSYTIDLIEGKNPQNPGWLATSDVHRVPSCLGRDFQALIIDLLLTQVGDVSLPKKYQAVITILNIVRMIEGLADPNMASVLEKSIPIDEDLLKEFDTYVSERLKPFKWDIKTEVNLFKFRFHLGKNGPNGKPKIESSIEEAICLLESPLFYSFSRIAEEIGVVYLLDYLKAMVSQESKKFGSQLDSVKENTKLRVLVSIPDSGLKTRIVAIPDFWTQMILLPIREHVQRVTERLFSKTDFRKDQDSGVAAMVSFQNRCISGEKVKDHTMSIDSLRFYDISAWTDRFHRDLQKVTMKHLFSPRLAEAWGQLVVHCSWYVPSLDSTVKYGQGQGMGTNGSFDIATLTDHLFINFVYDRHSSIGDIFERNRCYGKVGDDLWIYDPDRIFESFYGKINLPINRAKSKEYGKLGSVAEFCSRTYLNGEDASRISPKIVNKSADYRYIPMLLGLCSSRGVLLDASSFHHLRNIPKSGGETYFESLQKWIISYLTLGRHSRGNFVHLTREYLDRGNWLTEESKALLDNPDNLTRLMISHSIVQIVESDRKIKVLVSETLKAKSGIDYDDFRHLRACNLWSLQDPGQLPARKITQSEDILTPRQIVVMGRYIDQNKLVTEGVGDALSGEFVEAEDILGFSNTLSSIVSRSCYDQGILSYDKRRVYTSQFRIVETLKNLSNDMSTLALKSSDEVQVASSCIASMSEPDREWILRFLPKFDVAGSPTAPS